MKILETDEKFNDIIKEHDVAVFQFGSGSCTACNSIAYKLDVWEERFPQVQMRYIPIEKYQELSAQNGILSVPTISVYILGKEIIRETGYFSLEEILSKTEKYLKMIEN